MIHKESPRPVLARFTATISASGLFSDEDNSRRLVHLISVSPSNVNNSWSVLRYHSDFSTFQLSLQPVGAPPFPCAPEIDRSSMDLLKSKVTATRDVLQNWLDSILKDPYSGENPLIRQFLCFGANLYTTQQLERVNWVTFTDHSVDDRYVVTSNVFEPTRRHSSLDEMEMDDMFETTDDVDEESEDDEDEGRFEYFGVNRYQPVEEAVTQEDAMEIQRQANEIEMVVDVGSLAQSLGASHVGRSLQRQAELAKMSKEAPDSQGTSNLGVVVGGKGNETPGGGIGELMMQAQSVINRNSKYDG